LPGYDGERTGTEADLPDVFLRRHHERSNCVDNFSYRFVVCFQALFELGKLGGERLVRRERLAQAHEDAHHEDAQSSGRE
jgi:hypothetical protein